MPSVFRSIPMKLSIPKIEMPEFKKPELDFSVTESMTKKLWAGEIAVCVVISFISVVIAIMG